MWARISLLGFQGIRTVPNQIKFNKCTTGMKITIPITLKQSFIRIIPFTGTNSASTTIPIITSEIIVNFPVQYLKHKTITPEKQYMLYLK